jgi:hypothetical protein
MGARYFSGLLATAFLLGSLVSLACADDNKERAGELINFSYGADWRIGGYDTSERETRIFTVPASYPIRDSGGEKWGIKLLLPVSFGVHGIDAFKENEDLDSVTLKTFSFVPGVELEVPVRPDWTLKPFLQVGAAIDATNEDSTFIYAGGISSSYFFPRWHDFQFALGNGLKLSGQESVGDNDEAVTTLAIGLDMLHPIGLELFGQKTNLTVSQIYYWYPNKVEFRRSERSTLGVRDEFETILGVAARGKFSLFGLFEPERLALGYRYGSNVKALRLVFEFPF